MRKLRWISMVLLLAGASGLVYKLRADWHSFGVANDPARVSVRPLPSASGSTAVPAPDYTVVAQQNPFHPDRNDQMPPPPPVEQKPQGPPPLVYGSMLLGKEKYALMGTEGDPKPKKVVEGDNFQGYKLAEVKSQSVVLELGGSKNEVMFYNALSRLRREQAQRTQPPPPAPAAAGGTTTTVSAAAPTAAAAPSGPPAQLGPVMEMPPATLGATPPPGYKLGMNPFGYTWVKQ